MARAADVLHQVGAIGLQGAMDVLEYVERPGLAVDGVEAGDEIE
jgi:hypothetical protein